MVSLHLKCRHLSLLVSKHPQNEDFCGQVFQFHIEWNDCLTDLCEYIMTPSLRRLCRQGAVPHRHRDQRGEPGGRDHAPLLQQLRRGDGGAPEQWSHRGESQYIQCASN